MLKFLAGVLEQMDLALEHITKGGVHDARFGFMMTDNAVELVLHQIAKDQHLRVKHSPYVARNFKHKKELEEAMGRTFEAKLRFARLQGQVTEEQSRTIAIMHSFRNEVYHVGLQHEAILPDLARFYFSTACGFLASYKGGYFGYTVGIELPERSKKYFSNDKFIPGRREDFEKGCQALDAACTHNKSTTINSLADHMEEVIAECSNCLDIVADGVFEGQQRSRDAAVIDGQTWQIAFTTEGNEFAANNGYVGETIFELTDWLAKNYPLRFKKDPIPNWKRQAKRLRSTGNPHAALETYQSFMTFTAPFREALYEGASQVEGEIQNQIDMRRGK